MRQLPSSYALEAAEEPHLPLFGGLKTGNYWANEQSMESARARGVDEALLFSPDNHLSGSCMANAFVLLDGTWRTPPAGRGARAGVVREWVLGHLAAVETALTRSDMKRAEAVFLTSSWLGVMPVRQLDQRDLCVPETVFELRESMEEAMQDRPFRSQSSATTQI